MSTPNDGGSAFPQTQKLMNKGFPDTIITEVSGGISIRDYFAAQAIPALIARQEILRNAGELANDAYWIADAMLAERSKTQR